MSSLNPVYTESGRGRESCADKQVTQNLEHPRNVLAKPLRSLDSTDADRISAHLSDTGKTYSLTATERAALGAVVTACQWTAEAGR